MKINTGAHVQQKMQATWSFSLLQKAQIILG